jgi:hypothetical protein
LRDSPARAGHPSERSPRLVGVPNRYSTAFRGTFLHYYGCHGLSTSRCAPTGFCAQQKPPPGQMLEDLPSWCPTWEPGPPGTWGHPPLPNGKQRFDERRKRISILRAGGGPVNPSLSLLESHFSALSDDLDPGARHATTASHTEGQWLQTPLDYGLGTWMSTGRHYASRRQ